MTTLTSKEKHHSSSSGYKIQQQSLVNHVPRNVFFLFLFLVFQSNKPFDFCCFGPKKVFLEWEFPKRDEAGTHDSDAAPNAVFFWTAQNNLGLNPNIWQTVTQYYASWWFQPICKIPVESTPPPSQVIVDTFFWQLVYLHVYIYYLLYIPTCISIKNQMWVNLPIPQMVFCCLGIHPRFTSTCQESAT